MSSELARVAWRYSHARAYRVVLMESGHLAQTFALVATALGLASFSTGALADTVIEEAFSLSPATSPVVYAVGAANRPSGVAWAPYAHADAPRRRATRLGRHMTGGRDGD
jgi:nitroreductase